MGSPGNTPTALDQRPIDMQQGLVILLTLTLVSGLGVPSAGQSYVARDDLEGMSLMILI